LSAKRGKVNAHHFAHHQAQECTGAVESGLHRFAKAVLHHHDAIALPPVFVHGVKRPLRPFRTYRYRRTGEEVPLKGFVADVVLYGFERLIVELKVSHAVDPYKQRVFIRSGVQSVEIDVLAIFEELVEEGRGEDTRELARRIIRFGERNGGMAVHGRWLFNPEQHREEYRLRAEAKPRATTGNALTPARTRIAAAARTSWRWFMSTGGLGLSGFRWGWWGCGVGIVLGENY